MYAKAWHGAERHYDTLKYSINIKIGYIRNEHNSYKTNKIALIKATLSISLTL